MIHFGPINAWRSVMNMRQPASYVQASYAEVLRINCEHKATPFPITPTVLTVLTKASALDSKNCVSIDHQKYQSGLLAL
jgi:hypothetical protein